MTDNSGEADIDTLLYCVKNGGETGELAAAEIRRRLDAAEPLAGRRGVSFKPTPEPPRYSAKWISREIGQRSWLPLRECSMCSVPIGYVVNGDTVWFRSDCGCSCYTAEDRLSSFDEIAEQLAIQSSDEIRDEMMSRMMGGAIEQSE